MFCSYQSYDGVRCTVSKEYLPFPVNNMLLEIVGHSLCSTEILHCLRHLHTKLLTQLKEGIDYGTGREHDCSMVQNVDSLGTELSGSQNLHLKKRYEVHLGSILFRYARIRGCSLRRLLGNQYLLNTHPIKK